MTEFRKGLVLGKFMPLHRGHEYLIRFAKQYCEQLTVVVDCLEGELCSSELRAQWIAEQIPGIKVVPLLTPMPQDPADTPQFWDIWKQQLYSAVGGKPDVLVAAMDYGWELSKVLVCPFIQCDISRESVPISATQIRDNPMEHWDYLADSARGFFMKKLCLMGPESVGKSTCAKQLARQLQTVYVPEYAKSVIASQNGAFFEHNVMEVAIAQDRSERALSRMVRKLMVCDTDVLTTLVWSELLFGQAPAALWKMAQAREVDLTLLFTPEIPWKADIHRQLLAQPEDIVVRQAFFERCRHILDSFGHPYVVINGADYSDRYDQCLTQALGLIRAA